MKEKIIKEFSKEQIVVGAAFEHSGIVWTLGHITHQSVNLIGPIGESCIEYSLHYLSPQYSWRFVSLPNTISTNYSIF